MSESLSVTFWGVRGSISCSGPEYVRYGGNTSCLEVVAADRHIIFDAGSGIRPLGLELSRSGKPLDLDIFFTHTHLDHIAGLTFFAPMFSPQNTIRMWAGHLQPRLQLVDVIHALMQAPLYPVSLDIFTASVSYNDFVCSDTLHPAPGVCLRSTPLNHPNGASGYRVECGGKSICYITDTEHREGGRDEGIVELCRGADLMIYDSTYTDAEFPKFKGWGHSTWQEGVRLADAAEVGTLAIFHHDPNHDDEFMDTVAREAAVLRPGTARSGLPRTVVARERMTLSL